jgi:hypothetical protein
MFSIGLSVLGEKKNNASDCKKFCKATYFVENLKTFAQQANIGG